MSPLNLSELWGESEAFLEAKIHLSKAAKINRPILIFGERGAGKELAALRLHNLSSRWQKPYLTLNCAALSPSLIESELFGYEAGAFTGASRRSPGRFEAAQGGTLFLDEISHLSLPAQAKILRVVEYGSFQLVGSFKEIKVDVRIIAATNSDLKTMCQNGQFLPDLFDRLAFDIVTLPPLRERKGDINHLAHQFAARMALELGYDLSRVLSPEALEVLEKYSWPGNVRELKNVVERAVYKASGEMVKAFHLRFDNLEIGRPNFSSPQSQTPEKNQSAPSQAAESLEISWPLKEGEFDKMMARHLEEVIKAALKKNNFKQKKAATALGISYHRFRFLCKKVGLN